MAKITLDGEAYGDYSIAGLHFHNGQTDVDVLTVKQAYLLRALGGKIDGDVQILTPPAFQDETAPTPEASSPAHSTADDLAALGSDPTWDSIGDQVDAEPQLEDVEDAGLADDQYSVAPTVEQPVTDSSLDTPEVQPTPEPTVTITEGGAPDDETEQPQEPQDAPTADDPAQDATPADPAPETPAADFGPDSPEPQPTDADGTPIPTPDAPAADETEDSTPEALEDRIPPATDPIDTDAPAAVISEDPDGSTATEAAVQPADDSAGSAPADTTPADDTAGRHVADGSADTATA